MDDDAPHTLRWLRVFARVGGGMVLAVVLYVLSLGPAVYLFAWRSSPVARAAETFYRPLIWLGENTDLLKPLYPYYQWWASFPSNPWDR